jgi:hypothetical protein
MVCFDEKYHIVWWMKSDFQHHGKVLWVCKPLPIHFDQLNSSRNEFAGKYDEEIVKFFSILHLTNFSGGKLYKFRFFMNVNETQFDGKEWKWNITGYV